MTYVPDEQVAEDLEMAAELLETEKLAWCQEVLGGVSGSPDDTPLISACAVGAIAAVTYGLDRFTFLVGGGEEDSFYLPHGNNQHISSWTRFWAARTAVAIRLSNELQSDSNNVVEGWNDESGRTREEVVDLFKTIAKDLRNRA
jgi:hypothetical protein